MNTQTGKELIDSRKDLPVYGDRIGNMIAVAHIWSGILGFEIKPYQVPLMLAAMKIQRAAKTPEYKDSSDDVDGYMEIFREVMGEDLIEARTVEEFRARKADKELGGSEYREDDHKIETLRTSNFGEDRIVVKCSCGKWQYLVASGSSAEMEATAQREAAKHQLQARD